MATRPVSIQTVIAVAVSLASIGGFLINYQNSARSDAIAKSDAADRAIEQRITAIRQLSLTEHDSFKQRLERLERWHDTLTGKPAKGKP